MQAGFGAVCVAAGGYAVYLGLSAWRDSIESFQAAIPLLGVPIGLLIVLVGFLFIRAAFVPKRSEVPRNDTR